jgi:hypothetical protein
VTRGAARRALAVALALACAASYVPATPRAASAEEPAAKRLPFSDDLPAPPPLPETLDRRFHGEMTSFDGDRVGYRWKWTSDAELADFEPFVPVRASTRGGFERRGDGVLAGSGSAGLRLRLGMLSDLKVGVDAVLEDPHDLGVVLVNPGESDESILCLVQDRFFTRFDRAAGNTNMINKLGGVADKDRVGPPGMVEFRYIDRKIQPKLAKGHHVRFDVLRKLLETTFTITPKGEPPVVFHGKDTDAPLSRFQAGVYVAGSAARFGPLEIEGRIDPAWCAENGVLPFVANDLLHPGNRFKGPERKAAELVETFTKQVRAGTPLDAKGAVQPEALAKLVGDAKVPLVIRIRAAEALADSGRAEGGVGTNVAKMLDAPDVETRVLAWRVLRPRLPWHFRYEPDADPVLRREASLLVADFFRREADEIAQGKVFVEGAWYTPLRADEIRAAWDRAWDLRGPHVRLRTNLKREWADWTFGALEAAYREMTRLAGREPPRETLPVSVLLFASSDDFKGFCGGNGYEQKAAWGRFADLDRLLAFDTFQKPSAPLGQLHLFAKLFTRAATSMTWPAWFEEGRATWFAHPDYANASWDGTTLRVGQAAKGIPVTLLTSALTQERLWPVADFLEKDPRSLTSEERRVWYAYAWGLHAYLMDHAPEGERVRFAEWQSALEKMKPSPRDVDAMGRRLFMAQHARDLAEFEQGFRAWVKTL